jgi:hypothetical protein
MTLLIETHAWRGFSVNRDLFLVFVVVGWVTVAVTRKSILDRLRDLTAKLKELAGTP